MRKLSIVALVLLAAMLVSCGGEVINDTGIGGDGMTEVQEVIETLTPTETEAPQEVEAIDEHSPIASVSPTGEDGVYAIGFANGTSVQFDSSAANKAFTEAHANGFEGNLTLLLTLSALDAESKLYKGTNIGARAFGGALAKMFENYTYYFSAGGAMKEYEVKVNETEGYHSEMGVGYPNSATQTYRYTQIIKVAEGQTFELLCNGQNLPMRFITAYKNGTASAIDSIVDTSCSTTKFIVPKGVDGVVATFRAVDGDVIAKVSGTIIAKPALLNKVDDESLAELMGGEYALPEPDLKTSQASLKDGYVSLGENHLMNNKRLTLTFEISKLNDGEVISLGHGESAYGGSAVEITNTGVRAYYQAVTQEEGLNTLHGLDLSGKIKVTVKTGMGIARVSIETASDKFVSGDFRWGGRNGTIFAKSKGEELKNVELTWGSTDFEKEIWLFGDSYFNMTDPNRWPSYMLNEGYTDYLMSGFPGRDTVSALGDFKELLKYGTPKYAVWCVGMNNADSANGASSAWKNATDEFLAICKEKGITPILSTIPNTPDRINSFKNEVVKASGYRYIDFASAVGATEQGSPWLAGMLSGDGVHPSSSGAKALYEQVKKDFPEILK